MDDDIKQYDKYTKSYEKSECDVKQDYKRDETNDIKITLPPEHPLLEKFQQSLKQQLQKQIDKLNGELNELNIAIRKNTVERDDLGVGVYEAQQLVTKQQEDIESYESDIEKITVERQELEKELNNVREEYKKKKEEIDDSKSKDLELQNEIESLDFLMHKMMEWEKEVHIEVAVNKRMTEKSKMEKKFLSEEKRNLDFIIYKLMTENNKLEKSLEQCDMQIEAKEKEREELAEMIATSNADQEELESDVKRLMHSWNSVLVAISHRDKIFFATKTELENERERLGETIREITAEKKICEEEMLRNEQLTMISERINEEKAHLISKLNREQESLRRLQNKVEMNQALCNQTSKDFELISAENKILKNEFNHIRRETEKQVAFKIETEEKILSLLQEQMSNDKVSKYMNKNIKEKRELNRTMEINLASLENQNSGFQVQIEKQKAANEDLQKYLDELKKEQDQREKELSNMQHELHLNNLKVQNMYRLIDKLTKKLEEAIENCGGVEVSPEEFQIREMEKQIAEGEEKNKTMQIFWLRQQSFVLELTEKSQKQMAEVNLIRKQTLILEEKNLKVEDQLEDLRTQHKMMQREIKNYSTKLDKIYVDLVKKKDKKDQLNKTTTLSQMEYSKELKESELECLKLEIEIQDMDEEKNQLSKDLIDINREVMIWEKKVQMGQETKKCIEEEKGSAGELGNMQSEIHRMNVRHSQLQKAQDKLIQDLQHTLSRREGIWTAAESTEKQLTTGGKPKNRVVLQRKMQELCSKIKKSEKDLQGIEDKITNSYGLETEMGNELEDTKNKIDELRQNIIDIEKKIVIGENTKQKSLEKLIYIQNKGKMQTNIEKGTYKMLFRSANALEEEYKKELGKNVRMKQVIRMLRRDFPQFDLEFDKIMHTVNLVEEHLD